MDKYSWKITVEHKGIEHQLYVNCCAYPEKSYAEQHALRGFRLSDPNAKLIATEKVAIQEGDDGSISEKRL